MPVDTPLPTTPQITNIKITNNDLTAEECIDTCLGYGVPGPWDTYGWANYNPGTDEVCTCSQDCSDGYDTSSAVSSDATTWALEPVRGTVSSLSVHLPRFNSIHHACQNLHAIPPPRRTAAPATRSPRWP